MWHACSLSSDPVPCTQLCTSGCRCVYVSCMQPFQAPSSVPRGTGVCEINSHPTVPCAKSLFAPPPEGQCCSRGRGAGLDKNERLFRRRFPPNGRGVRSNIELWGEGSVVCPVCPMSVYFADTGQGNVQFCCPCMLARDTWVRRVLGMPCIVPACRQPAGDATGGRRRGWPTSMCQHGIRSVHVHVPSSESVHPHSSEWEQGSVWVKEAHGRVCLRWLGH